MNNQNAKKVKPDTSGENTKYGLLSSLLAALFILALIALWMLSGKVVIGGSDTDKVQPIAVKNASRTSKDNGEKKLFTVRARLFTSRARNEVLHMRARSEADSRVQVRAETAGQVIKTMGRKGAIVKQGSLLCKLDEGARRATLAKALALVSQTKSDYLAATKLARSGFSARLNVAAKKAAYDGALAGAEKARIDLENTAIKAPFTGIVEERPARIGDFLTVGAPCARLVKLHPLLVVGEVSERRVNRLSVGQKGTARFVTGEKVEGTISFISPSARTETRTFRVELQVDNRQNRIRNGITADVYLPLKSGQGHLISPAYMTLDDAGRIGVRTIIRGNIVRFVPVTVLEQGDKGVWVTGLPSRTIIITAGQEYVIDGQKVDVFLEKDATSGALNHERS